LGDVLFLPAVRASYHSIDGLGLTILVMGVVRGMVIRASVSSVWPGNLFRLFLSVPSL